MIEQPHTLLEPTGVGVFSSAFAVQVFSSRVAQLWRLIVARAL
jgi:hypothetical protein